MNLKQVHEIVKQIQSVSGRNDKENILAKHKDNDDLKYILDTVYNPFVILGLGDKKLKKFLKGKSTESKFTNLRDVVEYLKVNNTGRDSDAKIVADYLLNEYDDVLRQFAYEVITKKLKIGANVKSINSAFGHKFINEFSVQLAKKYEDEEHKVKGEFVITEKLDGMRCVAVVKDKDVKFFSRQGQPIQQLIEIEEHAKYLPDGIYDGELLIHNADDYKDRDVLQETLKITRTDGEKTGLVLHLFDYLPTEEFYNGKSKKKFIQRKNELINLIELLKSPFIKVVPNLYTGNNKNVIPELLQQMNEQGKEGLMLNTDSFYECKRTDQLLKIKSMQTMDIRVIGFEEGTGKFEGMLGALILDYKGYELRCGSGFTDEDRHYIWNHKDEYLNAICEIQYFRESKNADGGLSVSFPVFICKRDDKSEVSYY